MLNFAKLRLLWLLLLSQSDKLLHNISWGYSCFRFRRCCVQSTLKDGSAQFVFLYTLLRIFTFSFYTINVCTIYLWQKEHFWTLDTAALTCFRTLYPRIQRGHWRFFGTPSLTKATRIIPEGERNTADDELESVTDWETKLIAPLSPVFCSQMSNPWKIRWTILEPGQVSNGTLGTVTSFVCLKHGSLPRSWTPL